MKTGAAREFIRKYMAEFGINGFTTAEATEVSGMDMKTISGAISAECSRGNLFRSKIGHRTVKYFTSAENAATHEMRHRPVRIEYAVPVKIASYGRAPWTSDAPADISKAKITICPSPELFGPAAKIAGLK